MVKRQFKTVTRVSNTLYWDCPTNFCKQLHSITIPTEFPVSVFCPCKIEYTINMVSNLNLTTARILIEGEIK